MAGDFCPPTKGVVVFETIEQAQRAANTFTGDEHSPKVRMHLMNLYVEYLLTAMCCGELLNAANHNC